MDVAVGGGSGVLVAVGSVGMVGSVVLVDVGSGGTVGSVVLVAVLVGSGGIVSVGSGV